MLLVRAQQGRQRRAQHKGVLGTALHQLLLLVSLFLFPVVVFFLFFFKHKGVLFVITLCLVESLRLLLAQ